MFQYSKTDFDQLTPVEAYTIIDTYQQVREQEYLFFQTEFRTMNYFNIKSGMAETKNIRKPSDLYKLSIDKEQVKPSFDHSRFTEEDFAFMRKVLSN